MRLVKWIAELTRRELLRVAIGVTGVSVPTGVAAASDAVRLTARLQGWVDPIVSALQAVLFFELPGVQIPFVVLWLLVGACYFTWRMRFINIRGFRHAIDLTRGVYDDPTEPGEVSHFQALASALSATVGLGNIAGVTLAVSAGGPGAIFWLIVAGLVGMTSKFTECTLAQLYRQVDADGTVTGGPMVYLSRGLSELGWPRLGKVLGNTFAVFCVGGALGAGCMFQANQSFAVAKGAFPVLKTYDWVFGVVMAIAVGVVILGGIKRIAQMASRLVPTMCVLYMLCAFYVLATNLTNIPAAIALIVAEAFSPSSVFGGFLGVLAIGVQRAAFSNEAGVGSAAIAHSAAKTKFPVREGLVASLGPFIDTVVVCTLTGLVVVITGAYANPNYAQLHGAALTSAAFGESIHWFPYVLAFASLLFAYSTMIAWSYYGERCWVWLAGRSGILGYRIVFCLCVVVGTVASLGSILDLSDMMVLSMAFPNVLGLYLLSGKVRRELDAYWPRKGQ